MVTSLPPGSVGFRGREFSCDVMITSSHIQLSSQCVHAVLFSLKKGCSGFVELCAFCLAYNLVDDTYFQG